MSFNHWREEVAFPSRIAFPPLWSFDLQDREVKTCSLAVDSFTSFARRLIVYRMMAAWDTLSLYLHGPGTSIKAAWYRKDTAFSGVGILQMY